MAFETKRMAPDIDSLIAQAKKDGRLKTVPLNRKEDYYTNCPRVSISNVDQKLGWTKEEYKKISIDYLYLRTLSENDWYPHYIHILDNMIRLSGLFLPTYI
jgi:hypothetical protein